MTNRSHCPTKAPTRDRATIPSNTLQTRFFESSIQSDEAPDGNVQSQLDHANQFGHDFTALPIQAKLTVGAPNDQYEQEADRVAEQVMSMPDSATQQPIQRQDTPKDEQEVQAKPLAASITPLVQRQATMPGEDEEQKSVQGKFVQRQEATPEEDEESKSVQGKFIQRQEAMPEEDKESKPVQTKSVLQRSPHGSLQEGSSIESRLNNSKGGGSPLPDEVRSFMEPRFGADFSQVRIHTSAESVQMNRELGAQAFTHGHDIYFGDGKAASNDALTAHELTHVVQQTGSVQIKQIQRAIDPNYSVTNGTFNVTATPGGSPVAPGGPNLPIAIRFNPAVTAPYSNQIGLIQIVKLTDASGNNIEPMSLPAARGASLRTTADAAHGVEGGYFTDVLHNDSPATGGAGTDAPPGSALPPQYPFGRDLPQPNPATPGLSRPNSGGGRGAIVGYKRSNDPADIKAAELTDAPGYPTIDPANPDLNFNFETVAKGEDSMQIYGALKWNFQIRSGVATNENASVDDSQSATFDAALDRHRDFYVHEPVIFYFAFDSRTLTTDEANKIDTFSDYLRRFPDVQVTATGFADRRGDVAYNQQLSLDRASAVDTALRSKGVAATQIAPISVSSGGGETEAFTPDATTDQDRDANRRGNRRVVLTFRHVPGTGGTGGAGTGTGSTP
jgi:outer membrane protein OmpA-like peptidoglycan-associated protein